MGCGHSRVGPVGREVVETHDKGAMRPDAGTLVASPHTSPSASELTILHFNDVYELEERSREPVGGASRFKSRFDSLKHLNPLVVFSGDAISPSKISECTKGWHMVPVLNALDVRVAVFGNHEFDFGIEHLVSLTQKTRFPWLISNVFDKETQLPLAGGERSLVLEWMGWKVGFMGLVEWEWLTTLPTIEPEDVRYIDFIEAAREMIHLLKEEKCDLLVAITHMRMPNDLRLAEQVPELHLVLGGHDHHYETRKVGDVTVMKSGSDFRQFSQVTVDFSRCRSSFLRPKVKVQKHEITRDIPRSASMDKIVGEFHVEAEEGMEEELGVLGCDLDGRFSTVRTGETNLGNFIADIMRRATKADIALLNSGTLRSDAIHENGVFRMRDLKAILPMIDLLTLLEVTGAQLLAALENGVSQYPKHEGRFPQVSGLVFSFDPSQPSGLRVIRESVLVNETCLQEDKRYKLCTKGYIAGGKDGYQVFKEATVLKRPEDGLILSTLVLNYLNAHNSATREEVDGPVTRKNGFIRPQVEGRITIVDR